ncbi:SRPBCC family protein [Actinokineospora soli]|uniref:SRPBCC family protein n=1 Tax=Actinokineospora soli TaxID=1048753 RepID=A0ABW2TPS7_9PSEU
MTEVELTTPSATTIVLTRSFAARRRTVFDAWTKPELLVRWFGADGWVLDTCEVDLRVGGRWRFVSRGPNGELMGHGGEYLEVDAPTRLRQTESFDDQWFPGEAQDTLEFVEVDGGTTVVLTMEFPSQEVRDAVVASPMRRGVEQGFRRLDAVLVEVAA